MDKMYLVQYAPETPGADSVYMLEWPREWSVRERLGALFHTAVIGGLGVLSDPVDGRITVSRRDGHSAPVALGAMTRYGRADTIGTPIKDIVLVELLTAAITECARLQGHTCGLRVAQGKTGADWLREFERERMNNQSQA